MQQQQQQGQLDFPRIKILSLGDATVGKSCLIKRFCEGRFVTKYIPTIGIDYGVKKTEIATQSKKFTDIVVGTYHNPNFSSSGGGGGGNTNLNFSAVRVNFWDVAGGEESMEIRNEFYNATQGILLVFDVKSRESFDGLQRWWDEICQYVPQLGVGGGGAGGGAKRTSTTGATPAGKAVMNADGKVPLVMLLGNKCDDSASEGGGGGGSRVVTEQEAQQWAEQHHCVGYADVSASTDLHVQDTFETLFFHVIGKFM